MLSLRTLNRTNEDASITAGLGELGAVLAVIAVGWFGVILLIATIIHYQEVLGSLLRFFLGLAMLTLIVEWSLNSIIVPLLRIGGAFILKSSVAQTLTDFVFEAKGKPTAQAWVSLASSLILILVSQVTLVLEEVATRIIRGEPPDE